jgi:type IV pilus assembly protein PilZ
MSSKKQQPGNKGAGGKAKKPSVDADALHSSPRGSGDDEERSCQRVPIQLLVDYKSGGSYLFDFCKDLGTGGVFIQTEKPLATGTTLDLTFTIPDSKETLLTKGTVIWSQLPVADKKDLAPGMGIQFKGFSEEQRRLLENFVQRYHGEKMGKKAGSKQRAG